MDKGIDYLHVPTPDLTAPDMEKNDSAREFIHSQIQNNQSVMVHCAAEWEERELYLPAIL